MDNLSRNRKVAIVCVLILIIVSISTLLFINKNSNKKSNSNKSIINDSNNTLVTPDPQKDIKISFESVEVKAIDSTLKLKIFLETAGQDRVTAGNIVLKYPSDLLVLETLTTQTIQSDDCNKLSTVLNVLDDKDKGLAKFSKVTLDLNEENYPKGKFCFGEISFKLKENVTTLNSNIEFAINDEDFEIVGRDQNGNIVYKAQPSDKVKVTL